MEFTTAAPAGADRAAHSDFASPAAVPTCRAAIRRRVGSRPRAEVAKRSEWGDRCDTETGQHAIPVVGAQPCYLPFEGDNGGATAPGVTADSIKIVVYQGPDTDPVINYVTDAIQVDDDNADTQDTLDNLITLYETYYETYGRSVEVEYYVSGGIATDSTTASSRRSGDRGGLQAVPGLGRPGAHRSLRRRAPAARGIQCIGCAGGSQEEFAERAPYGIGLGLTTEQARVHNVAVLSKQVAGRPAEYAGDPEYQEQDRVFGYLHIETEDPESAGDAEDTVDALQEAGVDVVENIGYALDPATLQETAANAIARLKEAGVTTVIFAGDPVAPRDFTREATKQEYFPEWFLNISTLIDTNVFARTYDQEQWQHAFGLTALAARVDPEVTGSEYLYEWFFGETPAADDTIGVITPNPGLFFATLQEVGPELTNQGFADALFNSEPSPSSSPRLPLVGTARPVARHRRG